MEVILTHLLTLDSFKSILHVCGGDPLGFDDSWAKKAVFSTYVEVILTITPTAGYKVSILHVCGGDPDTRIIVSKLDLYSPRMWR